MGVLGAKVRLTILGAGVYVGGDCSLVTTRRQRVEFVRPASSQHTPPLHFHPSPKWCQLMKSIKEVIY